MRRLQIHWRPSQITPGGAAALAEVLSAHPGPDEVLVVSYDKRVRLGVTVDSASRGLKKEASIAADTACVIAIDTDDSF